MLFFGGIRSARSRCRTRISCVIDRGAANSAPRSNLHLFARGRSRPNAVALRRTPMTIQAFSTTRLRCQDFQRASESKSSEEVEKFVRATRQRFRDTLPKGYLTEEEYQLYERLYGPPLRETEPEDVGIPFKADQISIQPDAYEESSEEALIREVEARLEQEELWREQQGIRGQEEYVTEFVEDAEAQEAIPANEPMRDAVEAQALSGKELQEPPPPNADSLADNSEGFISGIARNQREYDALVKLREDFEAANLQVAAETERPAILEKQRAEEEEDNFEEEEEEDWEEGWEDEGRIREPGYGFNAVNRLHPLTVEGKFKTRPGTIFFSKEDFVEPIQDLLRRTSNTHIRDAAEKAFGGRGLPYSPATPESMRNMPMLPIGLEAGSHRMSEIEADAFIAAFLPPAYASITGVLVEVRKRLGTKWMRELITRGDGQGPRVLDVGAGGAGLLAWQDILNAECTAMREGGSAKALDPPGKKTVVVGSDTLRHRISRFLHNTTFLPRLPDYVHLETREDHIDGPQIPQARKTYDIIIASHLLLPVKEGHRRKAILNQLWSLLSPNGGVLICSEKANPRGFEAVAEVRQQLLDEYFLPVKGQEPRPTAEDFNPAYERVKEPGSIIAPCTTHNRCPMYLDPGKSHGRKDFCHFSQRYIRPPFLQNILGTSSQNHDDVQFSYVAMQRGVAPPETSPYGEDATSQAFEGYVNAASPPHMLSLPRNILPPLKRRGHVTLDLCTPAGQIERWTIPKSFSKLAYHDARKAKWGDLWALGAKTRVARTVRMGRPEALDDGGVRAQEWKSKMSKKPQVVKVGYGAKGILSVDEKNGRTERRTKTKTGKMNKAGKLMKELMKE